MERLEYRIYGLVPYNLSPIQQGIQFGHAVVEYMTEYRDFPDLTKWSEEDKTFIILNGGTTNNKSDKLGTLNQHLKTLQEMNVRLATFHEPDLGDQLTAVVFLLDERIWDEKKYPSPYTDFRYDYLDSLNFLELNEDEKEFILRVNDMGGRENWEIRKFVKQFRLA